VGDNNTSVKFDESEINLVDFQKIGYHAKPFIMAYEASQVIYIQDPTPENKILT